MLLFIRLVQYRLIFQLFNLYSVGLQHTFGDTPASIQCPYLDNFIKSIRLHLHELFIDCHATIHDNFSDFGQWFIFDVVIQPVGYGVQYCAEDVFALGFEG